VSEEIELERFQDNRIDLQHVNGVQLVDLGYSMLFFSAAQSATHVQQQTFRSFILSVSHTYFELCI